MLNMASWPYTPETKEKERQQRNKRSIGRQAGKTLRLLARLGVTPETLRRQGRLGKGWHPWQPPEPLFGVLYPRWPNSDPKIDTLRWRHGKLLGGRNGGERTWKWRQCGQHIKRPASRHLIKYRLRLEIQNELQEIRGESAHYLACILGIPGFVPGESFSAGRKLLAMEY